MGKTRPMRPLVRTFNAMTAAKARQGQRVDFFDCPEDSGSLSR